MNSNESQECTDDKCIACSLTEEFGDMVKDGVHWENALRHVLDVALTKDDETIADILDEAFSVGFSEGLLFGIEQSKKNLNLLYDIVEDEIAEKLNEDDSEEEDVIIYEEIGENANETLSDYIQRIIKEDS